jgi:hypothetical protein
MRRALALIVALLGSGACAAGVRWEKAGGNEGDQRRDETECTARANRDRSVPAQRVISRSSVGTVESIELVTVRDFDWGAFEECMRARGYDRVPPRPPG